RGGIFVQLFRIVATASGPQLREPAAPRTTQRPKDRPATRQVWWRQTADFEETAVFDRPSQPAGFTADGPGLLEDVDTVVVVPPGWTYTLDHRRTRVLPRAGGWAGAPRW